MTHEDYMDIALAASLEAHARGDAAIGQDERRDDGVGLVALVDGGEPQALRRGVRRLQGHVRRARDGMARIAESEANPTLSGMREFQELVDRALEFDELGLSQFQLPGDPFLNATTSGLAVSSIALKLLKPIPDQSGRFPVGDFAFGEQLLGFLQLILQSLDARTQVFHRLIVRLREASGEEEPCD
jgi:hypothetical protein